MLEPDLFTEGNLGLHYIETVSVNNWEVNRTVEPNYPRGDKDHHRKITRDILGHHYMVAAVLSRIKTKTTLR